MVSDGADIRQRNTSHIHTICFTVYVTILSIYSYLHFDTVWGLIVVKIIFPFFSAMSGKSRRRVTVDSSKSIQEGSGKRKPSVFDRLGARVSIWLKKYRTSFNPLWRHITGSTLVQAMACRHMAPSHYLHQC